MKRPLAKLSRNNHQKHIVDVMPLIAGVFGAQCYLMSKFSSADNTGDLAIFLGFALCSFIAGLFWYDKSHYIFIYDDRLEFGFAGIGRPKRVEFEQIAEIQAPEEEKYFSSLALKTKDGRMRRLYFVDYPKATKKYLMERIQEDANKRRSDSNSDQDGPIAA